MYEKCKEVFHKDGLEMGADMTRPHVLWLQNTLFCEAIYAASGRNYLCQ
jgi:hypothetical protein